MALTISEDDVPPIEPDEPTAIFPPAAPGEFICATCGFPIEFQQGKKRGKYHPECRPTQTATTSRGSRTTSVDTLISQIADLYRNVGFGVTLIPGAQLDGMAVSMEAGKLAESWRPLIEKDPKIRKAWERITTGSGWGTVVMVHAGIALAIASNHGFKLPGGVNMPIQQEVQTDD